MFWSKKKTGRFLPAHLRKIYKYRESVFMICSCGGDNTKNTYAMGFAITQSELISSYHFYRDAVHKNFYLRPLDEDFNRQHPLVLEFSSPELDLAVFSCKTYPFKRLVKVETRREVNNGELLCCLSMDFFNRNSRDPIFTCGYLHHKNYFIYSENGRGVMSFSISMDNIQGQSGSPIFDCCGKVVAFLYGYEKKSSPFTLAIDIKNLKMLLK